HRLCARPRLGEGDGADPDQPAGGLGHPSGLRRSFRRADSKEPQRPALLTPGRGGRQHRPLLGPGDGDHGPGDLRAGPPHPRVLTVSLRHEVMAWDLLTGASLWPEPVRFGVDLYANFSPDGEKVFTFDMAKRVVRVWDSRTGRSLAEPFEIQYLGNLLFPDGG